MQTLYDELEIAADASPEIIRGAFNTMATQISGGDADTAPERMEKLLKAYQVLSDPKRRADYDTLLEQVSAPNDHTAAPVQPNAEFPNKPNGEPTAHQAPNQVYTPPPIATTSSNPDALDEFLAKPIVPLLVQQNFESFRASWSRVFQKSGHNFELIQAAPTWSWQSATWSWPAFLCGPFYLCYRKMYGYAAAWTVVTLLIGIVELSGFKGGDYASIFLNGFFGSAFKGFYFRHVRAQAEAIEAAHTDPSVRISLATAKGGVSWPACIFGGLLCLIVAVIPYIVAAASESTP